jgi:hypothetical protein
MTQGGRPPASPAIRQWFTHQPGHLRINGTSLICFRIESVAYKLDAPYWKALGWPGTIRTVNGSMRYFVFPS